MRTRFENPDVRVSFERIDSTPTALEFGRNKSQLETSQAEVLDKLGAELQKFVTLRVEIATSAEKTEPEEMAGERERAIVAYFKERWGIKSERFDLKPIESEGREVSLRFTVKKPDAPVSK